MAEIYTSVKRSDYRKLIAENEALKVEVAKLKAELVKATAKSVVKTEVKEEIKKGGNK